MKPSRELHRPHPGQVAGVPAGSAADAQQTAQRRGGSIRSRLVDVALVAVPLLILLWTAIVFLVDDVRFVLLSPDALTSIDAASSLSRFFGALVLFLFPAIHPVPRFRWIAGGFVVLGLGGLLFRVIWPLTDRTLTLDNGAYATLIIWSAAGIMFVVGLLPFSVSARTQLMVASIPIMVLLAAVLLAAWLDVLPTLVSVSSADLDVARADVPLRGLSAWHWLFSSVPLLLALVAVAGSVYFYLGARLNAWLVIAMMLLAGSQFHNMFWPSAYSVEVTTADVLRFLFGAVVVTGAVIALCQAAAERQQLLAVEKEHSRRVTELATLKDNFTAMVAHELHSPLAAVRSISTMLEYPDIEKEQRAQAMQMIRHEVDLLHTLVNDVQDISAVERSSFEVQLRPTPLEQILEDVSSLRSSIASGHSVVVERPAGVAVLADRERIGQVLRNLLSNAVKYAPEGTSISIRAVQDGDRVLFEVQDQGPGIREEDQEIIFECFGRGSDPRTRMVRGSGLGLYLSRRIVEAHEGELRVSSAPGHGSTFMFDVRVST